MAVNIAADCSANGRKEGILAKSGEKPKALQLVFDRVLDLGEAELDSGLVQGLVQFALMPLCHVLAKYTFKQFTK